MSESIYTDELAAQYWDKHPDVDCVARKLPARLLREAGYPVTAATVRALRQSLRSEALRRRRGAERADGAGTARRMEQTAASATERRKREAQEVRQEVQRVLQEYPLRCTGDVVAGDRIAFTEAVFTGAFRKSVQLGERLIEAEILREAYGARKQQHTFTLRVIAAYGTKAQDILDLQREHGFVLRKGRNIYRNGTRRKRWEDEGLRSIALQQKHVRGDGARAVHEMRKAIEDFF